MYHLERIVPLCRRVIASVAMTALSFTAQGSVAASEPDVHLTVSQAGEFHSALVALADQGHVTLVAEGVPRHLLLPPQEASQLAVTASLAKEVDAVAAAYDYAAQRDGSVFILKKRYSDADDLPAVTQAEYVHALESMQKIASPFNPHIPLSYEVDGPNGKDTRRIDPLIDPFAESLTSRQMGELQSGKLSVLSLSPAQREAAMNILRYIYVQRPMSALTPALALMKKANAGAVFVQRSSGSGSSTFGYTLSEQAGASNSIRFHPLGQFENPGDLYGIDMTPIRSQASGPDLTEPSQAPISPTTAQALGAVVSAISHGHAEVNAALADKPVTVVGDSAPAAAIVRALADVYGLHLSGPPSHLSLDLPDAEPAASIESLPSALRQALPEPLARAMHLEEAVSGIDHLVDLTRALNAPHRPMHNPGVEETPAELEAAEREREAMIAFRTPGPKKHYFDYTDKVDSALSQIRVTAIRHLRTALTPALQAPSEGVSITATGQPEHDALATVIFVEATQAAIRPLLQPMSVAFSEFDKVVLSGGVYDANGRQKFRLSFGTPLPDGRIGAGPGVVGAWYNQ